MYRTNSATSNITVPPFDAFLGSTAYVDGQQTARWQGGGKSGVLGEGYLTVNW